MILKPVELGDAELLADDVYKLVAQIGRIDRCVFQDIALFSHIVEKTVDNVPLFAPIDGDDCVNDMAALVPDDSEMQ